jgi:hypothetical protein
LSADAPMFILTCTYNYLWACLAFVDILQVALENGFLISILYIPVMLKCTNA